MREYHFVVGDTPYTIVAETLKIALTRLRELVQNAS